MLYYMELKTKILMCPFQRRMSLPSPWGLAYGVCNCLVLSSRLTATLSKSENLQSFKKKKSQFRTFNEDEVHPSVIVLRHNYPLSM